MLQTKEVVKEMAEITGGTKVDAKAYLDAFKEVVVKALKRGEEVSLKGFVSFELKDVSEGVARNPRTGEQVQVPAHRRAKANLAKTLRKL